MATEKELLVSRIFLRAVLPVIKVMLEDDPKTRARFQGVNAVVQFVARDAAGPVGAHLKFSNGAFAVGQGIADQADLTFGFSSVGKMNAMFAGKPVLPSIKGLRKLGLVIKVFGLLLGLKILMPNAKPKTAEQARLKVKMTLYMVTTALSQLNKAGDPEMVKWTTKQPDRIYQWSCEPEGIACYLRVKAGKTKAGRGYYTRKKPFVHMKFNGIDGAIAILLKDAEFVPAVAKGYVSVEGAPEYAAQLNDFMQRVQAITT